MKLSVQESTLARVQGTLRDTEEEVRSLKETVAQQEDELHAGEMERRRLHNTIQELKASYSVGWRRLQRLIYGLGYLAREMLVLFSSFFLFDYFCTFEEMWVVNNQREDSVHFATTKLICHSCHTGKHPGLLQSAPIGGWRPQQTHPAPSQRRQDNNTRQNRGGENPVSIPDL